MRVLLLTLFLAFSAQAQTQSTRKATIYVYRNFYHTTFGRSAPTITINGEHVAILDEGRYFAAHVPAGFVIVSCGKKKTNRVEVDTQANETYYFRIRAHPGSVFARFEMFRVTTEEAKRDFDRLRYIEAKDVKSDKVIKDALIQFPSSEGAGK